MRFESWPSILAAKIEEAEYEPFDWGVNNCCLWTAEIVFALTGVDFASEFRDTYKTETEAYKALGDLTVKEMATSKLGEPVDIKRAKRGDVVLLAYKGMQTLGICIGATSAFKTPEGLIQLNTFNCECVWSVK